MPAVRVQANTDTEIAADNLSSVMPSSAGSDAQKLNSLTYKGRNAYIREYGSELAGFSKIDRQGEARHRFLALKRAEQVVLMPDAAKLPLGPPYSGDVVDEPGTVEQKDLEPEAAEATPPIPKGEPGTASGQASSSLAADSARQEAEAYLEEAKEMCYNNGKAFGEAMPGFATVELAKELGRSFFAGLLSSVIEIEWEASPPPPDDPATPRPASPAGSEHVQDIQRSSGTSGSSGAGGTPALASKQKTDLESSPGACSTPVRQSDPRSPMLSGMKASPRPS